MTKPLLLLAHDQIVIHTLYYKLHMVSLSTSTTKLSRNLLSLNLTNPIKNCMNEQNFLETF